MLIILEGPDCGGKTHLARRIADHLTQSDPDAAIEVLHRGPPVDHPLEEYERPLWSYRPGRNRHVICDRWHLGEWVYPAIFGRKTLADRPGRLHIELFLRSRGALLVHVEPPGHTLFSRYDARGDDVVSRSQLLSSVSGFRRALAETLLPVRTLNAVRPSRPRDLDVDDVIRHARSLESGAAQLNPFTTYIGPAAPTFLLVGDVRHEHRAADIATVDDPAPAFVPYPGTSGHYLLNVVGSYVHGAGVINVNDVDDARLAWELLRRPRVVALGCRAWNEVRHWGDHPKQVLGVVPHPQYVRRFHHRHGEAYGSVIAEALTTGRNLLSWRP